MGGHVFLEYMSYESISLREVMLCRMKCLMGGHALSACLQDGISYNMLCSM